MELAVCALQEANLVEQFIQFFGGAPSGNSLEVGKVSTRTQEAVHVTTMHCLGKGHPPR